MLSPAQAFASSSERALRPALGSVWLCGVLQGAAGADRGRRTAPRAEPRIQHRVPPASCDAACQCQDSRTTRGLTVSFWRAAGGAVRNHERGRGMMRRRLLVHGRDAHAWVAAAADREVKPPHPWVTASRHVASEAARKACKHGAGASSSTT